MYVTFGVGVSIGIAVAAAVAGLGIGGATLPIFFGLEQLQGVLDLVDVHILVVGAPAPQGHVARQLKHVTSAHLFRNML